MSGRVAVLRNRSLEPTLQTLGEHAAVASQVGGNDAISLALIGPYHSRDHAAKNSRSDWLRGSAGSCCSLSWATREGDAREKES